MCKCNLTEDDMKKAVTKAMNILSGVDSNNAAPVSIIVSFALRELPVEPGNHDAWFRQLSAYVSERCSIALDVLPGMDDED